MVLWRCTVCGYVSSGSEPPERCPRCQAQKEKFVTPVASGRAIGAYSLTEPMSGSDAGTMRSRAVRRGEDYLLQGRKSWVTSGPVANFILLFTMTDPEKKHKGITAFLVDTNRPGFTRGKDEPKLGIRASATCEIVFDDYLCSADDRLGDDLERREEGDEDDGDRGDRPQEISGANGDSRGPNEPRQGHPGDRVKDRRTDVGRDLVQVHPDTDHV